MSTNKDKHSELSELLEPSLLGEENEALYVAFRARVKQIVDPKNFFDEMRVQEITDKFWEEQRYKRFETKLIEVSCLNALAHLLAPAYDRDHVRSLEAACDFYSHNPKLRKPVEDVMSQFGMTPDMVYAKALAMNAGCIEQLDRMIVSRATSRNNLIKDHERRQKKAAKKQRRRSANDNVSRPDDSKKAVTI